VCVLVAISLYGLHSIIDIWVSGMFVGDGIYLVSLVCSRLKCEFIKFL
jgi:hypothetical protein